VQAAKSVPQAQLALAMGLRTQPISDPEFARQAAALKAQLIATMEEPAQHLGIRRIQAIFRANGDRLYHWAKGSADTPTTTWPSGTCDPRSSPARSASVPNPMLGPRPVVC
jgi:hypothetical protein